MNPAIDMKELRRLLEAATPGPWHVRGDKVCCGDPNDDSCAFAIADTFHSTKDEDAALIVALRNAAPDLLDRLESLEADMAFPDSEP